MFTNREIFCYKCREKILNSMTSNSMNLDSSISHFAFHVAFEHQQPGIIFKTPAFRSSHGRCSVRKGVLRNFENLQENTYVRVSFLIKVFNKETLTRVFSFGFCEFSKNTLQNTSRRLLLKFAKFFRIAFRENTFERLLLSSLVSIR